MKKKVTSLLLVFAMVLSLVVTAVPAHAAAANEFTIIPNKSEAYPGDTITYTVVLGPTEKFQTASFTLVIPEGLTFVSGAAVDGLAELTGADEAGFDPAYLTFCLVGLGSYTSVEDTTLMTFTCTVNSDAMGDYQIDIMDDYGFGDSEWNEGYMAINTAASKVSVVKKPVPATGIALNKAALTLKAGESETLVANVDPDDTTDEIVWSSSNAAVATVDASGKVTAVAEGTATITVKAGSVSASCVVTVVCAHTETTEHAAKESTCTEQGNNAYTTCNECDEVISGSAAKLPIDPDNHVDVTTYPAETGSCIESGHAAYSFCNDCESVISGSNSPVTGPHGPYIEKAEEKYLKAAADCENAAVYFKSCALCGVAHATETFVYGDALGHDMTDATCTTPKTCKVCGDTEGAALGHSFTNYVSNNDATCTEDGTKTAKCDRCDVTDTVVDVDSALGHDMADATCTAPKTCKVCGATEGGVLDHTYAAAWSKGEDGHWHECSACGDKTDFAAHNFGAEGDNCIICGYERSHIHRLTLVSAKEADCINAGNKAYYTCSGCENWFADASGSVVIADKASVVIDALGHDMADATCTTPKTCKVCGVTEGAALGHSFTNYVSNNDATCTEDGTKTAKCDRCDITDTVADVDSAKGHDMADATCTAPKTCKVCGATEGAALGHNYATTWSKGEDGHWHACSECGDKIDFAAHDFGAEGDNCVICGYERSHIHRLTLVPAKDADCTNAGSKAYYTCSGCEDWFADASGTIVIADKASVVINALGHDMADATCLLPKTCKVCGVTEGEALGHSFTKYASNNDATCTEDGTKTAKCDRCEVTDTVADVDSAKGHDMADATCTDPKTCKACGITEGAALGHSYETTWSKGEDGHWHACSACGDKADFAEHTYDPVTEICTICEYEKIHIHDLTLVPGEDATCNAGGRKAYYVCSGCEDWFEDASGSVVITDKSSINTEPLEHDMADATCTEPAKCKREDCDYTEGAALGHKYSKHWSFDRRSHWHECTRCDASTDKAAHIPGAAATEKHGQYCTECGYEIAPALRHVHKLRKVDATVTCTEAGNKTYYTCKCGKWFADPKAKIEIFDKDSVMSEALGHADANSDNKCDVCGTNLKNDAPTTPGNPNVPQTGDNNNIALWAALMVLSAMGVIGYVFYSKKRNAA